MKKYWVVVAVKSPLCEVHNGNDFTIVYGGQPWRARKTGASCRIRGLTYFDVKILSSGVIKKIRGGKIATVSCLELTIPLSWPGWHGDRRFGRIAFCCAN